MYKRASLNQKFSQGHFKLAGAIMTKHAVTNNMLNTIQKLIPGVNHGDEAAKAMFYLSPAAKASNEAGDLMRSIYSVGGLAPEAQAIGRNVSKDILEGPLQPSGIMEQLNHLYANHGAAGALGLGAAGLAGLGSKAALGNIKALQRTNPGMVARLMGAKPTGLTRKQLNALAGSLGVGAGVGAGAYGDEILAALGR
jgi:hypothetical protein